MKYILCCLLFFSACSSSPTTRPDDSVSFEVVKTGNLSVDETVLKLTKIIESKNSVGMKLFTIIDHKKGASSVALELADAKVVVFGNPNVGTKLMQANPLIGLDLPMKILIFSRGGKTQIVYKHPSVWKKQLPQKSHKILDKIAKILDKITTAIRN